MLLINNSLKQQYTRDLGRGELTGPSSSVWAAISKLRSKAISVHGERFVSRQMSAPKRGRASFQYVGILANLQAGLAYKTDRSQHSNDVQVIESTIGLLSTSVNEIRFMSSELEHVICFLLSRRPTRDADCLFANEFRRKGLGH